jgi:GNAT superfamily N-acetyltransferase
LLAFDGDEPVAWCAVAPRERYSRLGRSRNLKPIDDRLVWSVVCFFIAKPYRRQGVSVAILNAAAEYVREQGGTMVEGYPYEPGKQWPDSFAWTGTVSAFKKAGFKEVARRSPSRPIMRREV